MLSSQYYPKVTSPRTRKYGKYSDSQVCICHNNLSRKKKTEREISLLEYRTLLLDRHSRQKFLSAYHMERARQKHQTFFPALTASFSFFSFSAHSTFSVSQQRLSQTVSANLKKPDLSPGQLPRDALAAPS